MKLLDSLAEGYKLKLEMLINSCDTMEEAAMWDKEEFGEMDAYLVNELMSVVLPFVAVDEKVTEEETKYVNKIFGTEYSVRDLKDICIDTVQTAEVTIRERIPETSQMLKKMNADLEAEYREMYVSVCELIEVSDSELLIEEAALLKLLKETVNAL